MFTNWTLELLARWMQYACLEAKMKILLVILLALCACPKKTAEPVAAQAVVEDASAEDVVVMDAMVIDLGTLPD